MICNFMVQPCTIPVDNEPELLAEDVPISAASLGTDPAK